MKEVAAPPPGTVTLERLARFGERANELARGAEVEDAFTSTAWRERFELFERFEIGERSKSTLTCSGLSLLGTLSILRDKTSERFSFLKKAHSNVAYREIFRLSTLGLWLRGELHTPDIVQRAIFALTRKSCLGSPRTRFASSRPDQSTTDALSNYDTHLRMLERYTALRMKTKGEKISSHRAAA